MEDWIHYALTSPTPSITGIPQDAQDFYRWTQHAAIGRASLFSHLIGEERRVALEHVYNCWDQLGALPHPNTPEAIDALAHYRLDKNAPGIELEEYRRLDRSVTNRRTLCLDLEGLLVDHHVPFPHMHETLHTLRKQHGLLITSAMPQDEAEDLVRETGTPVSLIFGDSALGAGKQYQPVASFLGQAPPYHKLLAIGHESADVPVDIPLAFVLCRAPAQLMHRAIIEAAAVDILPGEHCCIDLRYERHP